MSMTTEKYLMLFNSYEARARLGEETETTTEEVAQALFCTARNAKLIVKRLVEERLIAWHSGKGRGNVSRIVFLAEKEPLLIDIGMDMARKGDYKQAFELFRHYGAGKETVERYVQWLNGHFGYRAETSAGSESLETFRFPIYYPIGTMDPAMVYYAFDAHMMRQVYDRLVEYDAATGSLKPGLAHYWESNADMTEWTFYLRKGIKFHHGRELRAEDVRHTIERTRGSKPSSWLVRTVKEVVCEGPRAVRIVLDRPNAIFPRFTSSSGMSILPRDALEENEERFWSKPIGTGPFRIANWTANHCELVVHPDYFQGRAHMDRLMIAFMPEETASLSDNVEWRHFFLTRKGPGRDDNANKGWRSLESLCRGSMLMTWNASKEGPQRSEAFRRAFGLFLNRRRMIRELGEDRAYPARGFRPTEKTPDLNEEFDEEEARRLLRQSGYAGEPFVLCTYETHEEDARWIARRCAEFGVNVEIRVETHSSVRKDEALAVSDGLLFCLVFAVEDVCEIENYEQDGNFLKEHLGGEIRRWVTEEIDRALACREPSRRRELLDGIESRLREESHVTFVLHKKLNAYVHPAVKGVGLNPFGWVDFKDVWLENREIGG